MLNLAVLLLACRPDTPERTGNTVPPERSDTATMDSAPILDTAPQTTPDAPGIRGFETEPWGRFQTPVFGFIGLADVNADSRLDLVAHTERDVIVFRAPFASGISEPEIAAGVLIEEGWTHELGDTFVGHFNLDGQRDVVVQDHKHYPNDYYCFEWDIWAAHFLTAPNVGRLDAAGDAFATLTSPTGATWSDGGRLHFPGDLDGDGLDEVYVVHDNCYVAGSSWLVRGVDIVGTVPVDVAATATIAVTWEALPLGDVDGDGRADLVIRVPDGDNTALHVFTEPPLGAFSLSDAAFILTAPPVASDAILVSDVTRDGKADLVMGSPVNHPPAFYVFEDLPTLLTNSSVLELEDAWASWTPDVVTTKYNAPRRYLSVADIDGDGFDDIIMGLRDVGIYIEYEPQAGAHPMPQDGVDGYAPISIVMHADEDPYLDIITLSAIEGVEGLTSTGAIFRGGPGNGD